MQQATMPRLSRSTLVILREQAGPRRFAGRLAIGGFAVWIGSGIAGCWCVDLGLFHLFLRFLAAVLFVVWFREAYNAVWVSGVRGLGWSPGWAAGSWFIPLANLVIPYLVAVEMWKASDPEAKDTEGWRLVRIPPFVVLWWAMFVLHFPVNVAFSKWGATGRVGGDVVPPEMVIGVLAGMIVYLVGLGLSIVFVVVVNRRIDTRMGILGSRRSGRRRPTHWTADAKWWHWVAAAVYLVMFLVPPAILTVVARDWPARGPACRAYLFLLPLTMLIVGIWRMWPSGIIVMMAAGGLPWLTVLLFSAGHATEAAMGIAVLMLILAGGILRRRRLA